MKLKIIVTLSLISVLASCSKEEMPEVNDLNCAKENIAKIKDVEVKDLFMSLCASNQVMGTNYPTPKKPPKEY